MDAFRSSASSTFNGSNPDHQHLPLSPSVSTRPTVIPSHTSLHMSSVLDFDSHDAKKLDDIRRILLFLDDINHGRHVVHWADLVDPDQPVESAKKINAALAKPTALSDSCNEVAKCITTPAHLSIIASLEPPFRTKVRDAVLQDLLNAFSEERHLTPMPLCSEMLTEMVRLNLVVLRGVAMTLETFLKDTNSRRAAIAALGRLAEQHRGDETFQRAVQNVEPVLHNIQEAEFDYDCLTISRLLGWNGADKAPALIPAKTIAQSCPVTSMVYFRQRDELVSATCDGALTIWGTPNPNTGDMKAAVSIDFPLNYVPIAMSGASRGTYLVIAATPFPAASIQAMGGDASRSKSSSLSHPTHGAASKGHLLRLLTCNENTGAWKNGETISRKEHTALTAVAALANLIVCAAESVVAEKPNAPPTQHDLVFLSGQTAQTTRRVERAHEDYTTVLRAGEDGGEQLLLSGSRDAVVKLWDLRAPNARATRVGGHRDTVTAILSNRRALLTASIDGALLVWDARRTGTPLLETRLAAPILDLAIADGGHVGVATARGVSLLSMDSLRPVDMVSNVAYTQLLSNYDATTFFAAGMAGIDVYALRR